MQGAGLSSSPPSLNFHLSTFFSDCTRVSPPTPESPPLTVTTLGTQRRTPIQRERASSQLLLQMFMCPSCHQRTVLNYSQIIEKVNHINKAGSNMSAVGDQKQAAGEIQAVHGDISSPPTTLLVTAALSQYDIFDDKQVNR